MKTLFFYGTLQMPSVQIELLGREFTSLGVKTIDGYVAVRDYFVDDDFYPRLVQMNNGVVYGNIYQMTDEEIAILNEYESDAYELREMTTTDGMSVYVYMESESYDMEQALEVDRWIRNYKQAMLDEYDYLNEENAYPFKHGDVYYTIEDDKIIESVWDDVSEELYDQDSTGYYAHRHHAESVLKEKNQTL